MSRGDEAKCKIVSKLSKNNHYGFDTSLIKILPKAHIITCSYIKKDKKRCEGKNIIGTTARGIGPCYRDKFNRIGKRVMVGADDFEGYIWDEVLYGNILYDGSQGIWLDINYSNYPYVTCGNPFPYGACSLGFGPQYIRKIYGAIKIYDTRAGPDPDFPEKLSLDQELLKIGEEGKNMVLLLK